MPSLVPPLRRQRNGADRRATGTTAAAGDCLQMTEHESLAPMEALLAAELPAGEGWQYEPKWDGFRCLALRDGDEVTLTSKSGKPLARYFPEVVAMLLTVKERRFILDGELIIPIGDACRSTRCSCACIRPRAASASCPPRHPPS